MTGHTSTIRQVPRLLGIGLSALVVTAGVQGIWSALLVSNLKRRPTIPWAVAAMAVGLWTLWQYADGRWWPSGTSRMRRAYLRAHHVSARVFAVAVTAGACALVALTGLWIVLFQSGLMRGNRLPDLSPYPTPTVVAVLLMAALVGAFAEEAGFRGYLQVALEREVSAPVAVAIAALALTPGHGATQGFAWPTVVFYFFVDVMLGVTAWACNSVWPGIVVHSIGLLIFFTLVWPFDAGRPVFSDALTDPWFWLHAVQALVFTGLAVLAFQRLTHMAKKEIANPAA
jgi:membrane protease YdiL (CAAX protease family)